MYLVYDWVPASKRCRLLSLFGIESGLVVHISNPIRTSMMEKQTKVGVADRQLLISVVMYLHTYLPKHFRVVENAMFIPFYPLLLVY